MRAGYDTHPSQPVFTDTPTFAKVGGYREVRTDCVGALDWLGHSFMVGDEVMYCIGAGRGQMMAIGTVQAMRGEQQRRLVSWDWEEKDGQRTRRINDVYEDYWEVEVQVLTQKTSGAWSNKERSKPAWVNPMNITSLAGLRE